MSGRSTPSQTVGPFFGIGFSWLDRTDLTRGSSTESPVTISGRAIDGVDQPVPDAVLEIWQADGSGQYSQPEGTHEFFGFGRVPVDSEGKFRFTTCKPGSSLSPNGTLQAPHLVVSVFMRGLLKRLITRIYFPGDSANESDPVLRLVPAHRRHTLIARRESANGESFVWDVHLQGDKETVFFDC
jgi:protocatechuate 3,4-dioxygenase, alpha subunit